MSRSVEAGIVLVGIFADGNAIQMTRSWLCFHPLQDDVRAENLRTKKAAATMKRGDSQIRGAGTAATAHEPRCRAIRRAGWNSKKFT